jgi:hypothetical protein
MLVHLKTNLRLRHPSGLPFFPINTSSLFQDNVSVASEGRLRAAVANRMKNHRNLANTAANHRTRKSIDTVTTKPASGIDSSVESQLNETVDGINPDRVRVQVHQSPVPSQCRMTAASIEGTGLIDNSLFVCCYAKIKRNSFAIFICLHNNPNGFYEYTFKQECC